MSDSDSGTEQPRPDVSDDEHPEAPDDASPYDWSFEEDEEAVIVTRGFPEAYDLNYVVLVRLDPSPADDHDVDMVCLASDNQSLIENINLNKPSGQLNQLLKDKRIELQLDGSGIDNQVIQDKFRSLFLDRQFTSDLSEHLRQDDVPAARELLIKRVGEDVFPGSGVEQECVITRWIPSSEQPTEEGSSEDVGFRETVDEKPGDSRMLTVSPKIRPFLGTKIGTLQPGDVFEVRVVGESAGRLRSEFLDNNSTDDKPYSKPLEARLISLEQGDVPQEIKYLVELADGVYGIGTSARDARVYSNEQLVRSKQPSVFYTLRVVLFACSLLLFATLILLFVVL